MIGKTFGRLKVYSYYEGKSKVACKCSCGEFAIRNASALRSGDVKSCGCLKREIVTARNKRLSTHKATGTAEYHSWAGMKQRCYCKTSKDFHRYGGRGISMCPEWLNSFETFLRDMGAKPSVNHSVEREDVNGNYAPSNCVWATAKEQANNRRNSHVIELDGVRRTLTQWADNLHTTEDVLRRRIQHLGWSIRKAVTTPVRRYSK